MLGLNETIDELAMANSAMCAMTNSAHWYGHFSRREDGHVLRRALDLEVGSQRKKERPKMTLKKQADNETIKVGLKRDFDDQSGCWALIRLLLG